jgi:hypothetical protein
MSGGVLTRGAPVVFGWAGFNALLAAVLVIYDRDDPFPLIVYAIAVVLVGSFGVAVLRAARRSNPGAPLRTATRSASAGFAAIATTFIGLGFFYGYWLMLVAAYPILLCVITMRSERVPAGVLRAGTPVALGPDGQSPPQQLGSEQDSER